MSSLYVGSVVVLISVVERERYTRNGTTRSVFSGTGTSTACSERFSPKSGWVCEFVCASVSNGKPGRGDNGKQEGGHRETQKAREFRSHTTTHKACTRMYACTPCMCLPHVCTLCVCSMFALYICTLCMYSMYILYVCTPCLCRERALRQIAEAAVRAVWARERHAPTPIAASSSSFSDPEHP